MSIYEIIRNLFPNLWINAIFRIYYHYKFGVKFGFNVKVNKKLFFEGKNVINSNTKIGNCYLGLGTYIADNSEIFYTKFGKFCSIGKNLQTCLGLHPSRFVSTHPAFYSLKKQAGFTFVSEQKFEEHKFVDKEQKFMVEIGNDVWIGINVVIMDGVVVGDGAIIASGSVVVDNIKPYTIVGGVPAKLIRMRFEEEQIKRLLEFKWWEKDYSWLQNHIELFTNVNKFFNK